MIVIKHEVFTFSRDYYHISAAPKLSCKISHVKTFRRKKGFFLLPPAPEAACTSWPCWNNHRSAQGETRASGSKVNARTKKKEKKKKKSATCQHRKPKMIPDQTLCISAHVSTQVRQIIAAIKKKVSVGSILW